MRFKSNKYQLGEDAVEDHMMHFGKGKSMMVLSGLLREWLKILLGRLKRDQKALIGQLFMLILVEAAIWSA